MVALGRALGNERLPAELGLAKGKPSPREEVDRCAAELKMAAGDEIAANAAAIAAMFAAITIPVDASGHSSPELARLQPVMNRIVRWANYTKAAVRPLRCCARRATA